MEKIQRSWLLFKGSLSIIKQSPKLLAFPMVVMLFTVLILLLLVAPVGLRPTGHSYATAGHWEAIGNSLFTQTVDANGQTSDFNLTREGMLYVGLMYFISMFFAVFFNVAFYHEILGALNGKPVSIRGGLWFACSRWKAVLMWTLFAGLVGLIIQQIEQRLSFAGRIITRFIGMAWGIASVFVIPAIVQDETNSNPIKMLRDSAGILKRTWGESLIGFVGMSFAAGFIMIVSIATVAGAFMISALLDSYWIFAVGCGLSILSVLVLSYVANVAGQIFKGALYLYAAEGRVAGPYSRESLDSAWKFKKS